MTIEQRENEDTDEYHDIDMTIYLLENNSQLQKKASVHTMRSCGRHVNTESMSMS